MMSNAERVSDDQSNAAIVTVFEHQRLQVSDFLYATDFEWLMAQEFAVFTILRQRGQWQLKVGHYIGIVLLPSGMTLEILPKTITEKGSTTSVSDHNTAVHITQVNQTRQWVQSMLCDLTQSQHRSPHTKNVNHRSLGQISHQSTSLPIAAPPLSDWVLSQFLQRLSLYQPTKQYQTQTHQQSSLQGRLLIKEQLRCQQTQPHMFVCEMSVLSQDMLGNRLIKSALERLTPLLSNITQSDGLNSKILISKQLTSWRHIHGLRVNELYQLDALYRHSKRELAIQPLSPQQKQNAKRLVDLAYWLLQNTSVPTGYGVPSDRVAMPRSARPSLCLLIDMNQAFEQWVSLCISTTFLQASTQYRSVQQPQRVWLSDAAGQACLSIRPDLLVTYTASDEAMDLCNSLNRGDQRTSYIAGATSNQCVSHVIDIKWKHLPHAGSISASDAYQLTSYAQAYQAKTVWLVYPVLDEQRQPVALSQHAQHDYQTDTSTQRSTTKLWLMPFNVKTGTLNGDLYEHIG